MNTASTASKSRHARGFTIIELMVTLAVAAVLIGLALPAFNGFVAQRTLTTQVNDFMVAIQYARNEAGRRGTTVSVRAEDASANANEWGPGWCVVVGTGACTGNDLRDFKALGANTLNATGGLDGIDTLSFNSQGLLLLPPATPAGFFQLCNPQEHVGREISLALIGRVSSREPPVAELDCAP